MNAKLKKYFFSILMLFACVLSLSAAKEVQAKTLVPSKVTLVSASSTIGDRVTIEWKAAKNATHYRVYRMENGHWTKIATLSSSKLSYTHIASDEHHMTPGKSYRYTVRAYNKKSNTWGDYDKTGKTAVIPNRPTACVLSSVTYQNGVATLTWKKNDTATHYAVYYKNKTNNSTVWKRLCITAKTSYTFKSSYNTPLIPGHEYVFTVRTYNSATKLYGVYDTKGLTKKIPAITASMNKGFTIKKMLLNAIKPMGKTMYILGSGRGTTLNQIGVSPYWEAFFKKQKSDYNHRDFNGSSGAEMSRNGLDCSSYVAWTLYNTFETVSGNPDYVVDAKMMAYHYSREGWGTYTYRTLVKDHRAGDIMSSLDPHVYICIGECSDGSVVFFHCSPPGVMISGTPSKSGNTNSEAIKLATYYMKKYFPAWMKKYPNISRSTDYLKNYSQMRWDTSGKSIMTDPDCYQNMTPAQVLADLFASR